MATGPSVPKCNLARLKAGFVPGQEFAGDMVLVGLREQTVPCTTGTLKQAESLPGKNGQNTNGSSCFLVFCPCLNQISGDHKQTFHAVAALKSNFCLALVCELHWDLRNVLEDSKEKMVHLGRAAKRYALLFLSQVSCTSEPWKKPSYFPLYWLFSKDPYNGLL